MIMAEMIIQGDQVGVEVQRTVTCIGKYRDKREKREGI